MFGGSKGHVRWGLVHIHIRSDMWFLMRAMDFDKATTIPNPKRLLSNNKVMLFSLKVLLSTYFHITILIVLESRFHIWKELNKKWVNGEILSQRS